MWPRTFVLHFVLHFAGIMVTGDGGQFGFSEDGYGRSSRAPLLFAMMTSACEFMVYSAKYLLVRSVNL